MADDSFRVRCVLVDGADKPTDPMEEAFKTLDTQGFKPEWYTELDCLDVTHKEKNCAYIFDPFEGKAFQFISSLGCRILGPQCILTALHYKMEIPRRRSPVHNLAMKNVIVCCTSMEKVEREDIYHRVDLMGGTSSKDFTEDVTHLIAKEVGSKKYQVAVSLGKQVMTPEWVDGVWNIAKLRHIHATDGQFQKYKCSIFQGLVICVSGLDTTERKEVKKLVEQEGGIYSGDMKMNHCTHLIINEPQGQKYEFAKRWNVMVVRAEWVYDCIEKGHYIEETKYLVREGRGSDGMQTSTPEKENGPGGVSCLADISSISNISMAQMSHVNETAISNNTMRQSMMDIDPLLNLDISKTPSALFLDGCKIYLEGFQGSALEKVRKLINSGGGTRFNTINESVTHVIMTGVVDKDIAALKIGNFRPHIVSSAWLIECFKKGCTVDEEVYACVELPPLEPNSPKLKGKRKSDASSKRKSEVKPQQTAEVKVSAEPHDDEIDIMSQYLPQPEQGMAVSRETTVVEPIPSCIDFDEDMTQEPEEENKEDDEEPGTGLFRQKSFMIFGFEEEDTKILTEYIVELGGKVLNVHSRAVPYYGIVPLNGFQVDRTVREVVTNAWLQMCLEQDALLEVSSNELFTPVEIRDDATPLAECVISVSGYTGAERDCLMHLSQLLGATCQEYLVRNANKGFEPNTHLIVKEPEGSKYQAAKKWGLPIVSKKWLLACAKSGKKEPESSYPVISSADAVQEPEVMEVQNIILNKQTPQEQQEKISQKTTPKNELAKPVPSDAMEVDNVQTETRPVTREKDNKSETCLSVDKTLKQKVVKKSADSRTSLQTFAKETAAVPNKEISKSDKISQDSQKENKSHKTVTPHIIGVDSGRSLQSHTVNHNRVTELQNESLSTPKTAGSNKRLSIDSPALEPFDLTSCMEALGSPVGPSHRKTNRRKSNLPLDELFIRQVEAALKTHSMEDSVTSVGDDKEDGKPMEVIMGKSQPLAGVIIAVSKKLTLQQAELNDIVAELGGDYKWTYDSACTHFIFQGKTNDMSKEFRLARQQNKIIVSPHWVHACKEKEAKVEEALYPQNYNPNLSLKMNTPARTPGRYSRKTRLGSKTETEKKDLDEVLAGAAENIDTKMRKASKQAALGIITGGETKQKESAVDMTDDNKAAKTKVTKDATPCEVTGTLEMTEMMTKELENIMNSSKPKKHGQRRSKKHNSSGQLETSGTSAVDNEVEAEKRTTRKSSKGSETHSGPEQSQSLQVTWDDPTGRLEQEKLAHKLERAFSPTQEVDNMDGLGLEEDAQFSDVEEQVQLPEFAEHANIDPVCVEDERTPTPDAPKIAFPMPKKPVMLTSPQPVKIEDAPERDNEQTSYVFILSGMSQEERDDYGALVEQLGGKMLDLQNYDPQCTHLVVGTPARNEKFLACVAAGKWVLHKSYFEACRQEKKFALEDFYEWGGDGTESLVQTLTPQVVRLANAAYRWRVKIQQEKKKNPKCHGAFGGWEVVLCTDRNKEANFRRLLIAGGANVLSVKPPFTKTIEATHAFLEPNKVPISEEDIECLVSGNVLCLRPDFIASHLTANPPPLPKDYCPPEIASILKRISKTSISSSKRKSGLSVTSNTSQSKRTRKY